MLQGRGFCYIGSQSRARFGSDTTRTGSFSSGISFQVSTKTLSSFDSNLERIISTITKKDQLGTKLSRFLNFLWRLIETVSSHSTRLKLWLGLLVGHMQLLPPWIRVFYLIVFIFQGFETVVCARFRVYNFMRVR